MYQAYLDNAATTQVCKEAADKAFFMMTACYGNPSSLHTLGTRAESELQAARAQIALLLGCTPAEVYFTSGGTEANNIAIQGAAKAMRRRGSHMITSEVEHASVLNVMKRLEQEGAEVTYLRPDTAGVIALSDIAGALRADTVLVSVMLVNNETGAISPVKGISALLKRYKSRALLHTDAVQGAMKLPLNAAELGVDMLTISGHKFHAPKGVGALYIKKGVRILPLFSGGGQERGIRPGTEALSSIAAMGEAVRVGIAHRAEYDMHIQWLKDYAVTALTDRVGRAVMISSGAPHILGISLPGLKSEVVLHFLESRGLYVSSGSACGKGKHSHVLTAMGLSRSIIDGFLRVSLSRYNTQGDIDALCTALNEAIIDLKEGVR